VDGAVEVRLPGGRVAVERLDVHAMPERAARLAVLRAVPRVRVELAVRGLTAELDGRRAEVRAGRVLGVLATDLSRLQLAEAAVEGAGFSLAGSGLIEDLCRPRLSLDVVAGAEVPALAGLLGRRAGDTAGTVEARVSVEGRPSSPAVSGEISLAGARIGRWTPGDAHARVALRGSELRVEELRVPGRAGGAVLARGVVRLGAEPRLEAEADLREVQLAEVLDRAGVHGSWVTLRATGTARIAGTLAPLALDGEGALDVAAFRVDTRSWEQPRAGARPVIALQAARVETAVKVSRESVRLEGARLGAGAEVLRADVELFLKGERGFTVRAEGRADLDALGHVSTVPIGGRATVRADVRAAPYGNPRVDAQVGVAGLRFLQLDLGDVDATFEYGPHGNVLRAVRLAGQKGETRFGGAVAVDLARSPPEVLEGELEARGRLRDLFDAVLPWLPSTRVVRDAMDGAVEVRASARGPATALDAQFSARLGAGALLGRAYDSGAAEGRVEAGARAFFRSAELRRGGGTARASGRWEFPPPHAWDLDVAWAGLPLPEVFASPATWTGTTSGTARLRRSLESPDVAFSATGEGAEVAGVPLRALRAEGTLDGERLALRATAEGLKLAATGEAAGGVPFEATVELDHDDLGALLRAETGRGARVRARGSARLRGTVADVTAASGDLRLDRLEAAYADLRVGADEPVSMRLADRRLEVRPFRVRGHNTELVISGAVNPGAALALDAAGTLDLRVLGDTVPRVTGTHGLLAVQARIGGTPSSPLLVGSGSLRDGGFQFRDVPIAFSRMGGDLAFSQTRVIFDRLDAVVNGGRAVLQGEVELVKLFPRQVRIHGDLEEVPLRIPAWLPTVVSGSVTVAGGWDSMDLGGRLRVVRARYTERVDLERSVLEFRRRAALAKPYDPAGEWLRFDVDLVVDGDARVENDLVRGTARGEVTLTGTLGSPGVVGKLTLAEGSRATFRGNEFALSHAVADFTERRSLMMHLDVYGQTQVREYQVFMHLSGPWDAPVVALTSQPSLTQEDLVALLSLGFTTRDAATAGAAGGVATAAAAQALFSVSGLDEQVKRFMPRGGPLSDFTVRMTTAYSEGTGQVEPRAEFESRLIDERLRLRWQAPLSGARGQRAQAELRVGGRASLQYQWENDNADVTTGGDHGLDLKLRWEWVD
jgi:translocation and assembly module TamB